VAGGGAGPAGAHTKVFDFSKEFGRSRYLARNLLKFSKDGYQIVN
jgi:hypothetical protein